MRVDDFYQELGFIKDELVAMRLLVPVSSDPVQRHVCQRKKEVLRQLDDLEQILQMAALGEGRLQLELELLRRDFKGLSLWMGAHHPATLAGVLVPPHTSIS